MTKNNSHNGQEFELGKTEYDLRDFERKKFSDIYTTMLESKFNRVQDNSSESFENYVGSIQVLAQYLKHYMSDEDMVKKAKTTEKLADRMLTKLHDRGEIKISRYRKSPSELQDNIEQLRHEAGLKLPQESKTDPETVGVDQL